MHKISFAIISNKIKNKPIFNILWCLSGVLTVWKTPHLIHIWSNEINKLLKVPILSFSAWLVCTYRSISLVALRSTLRLTVPLSAFLWGHGFTRATWWQHRWFPLWDLSLHLLKAPVKCQTNTIIKNLEYTAKVDTLFSPYANWVLWLSVYGWWLWGHLIVYLVKIKVTLST